jgi:hypothetical protein
MAFEGDDSLLCVSRSMLDHAKSIEDFWKRTGHNMKLVVHAPVGDGVSVATFVGWHVLVDAHGPTLEMMPEIRRALASSGWTTSGEVLRCLRDGGAEASDKVYRLSVSSLLSRASGFAGVYPELCRFFMACAMHSLMKTGRTIGELKLEREDAFRVVEHSAVNDATCAMAVARILNDARPRASRLLRALGMDATEEYSFWVSVDWECPDLGGIAIPQAWI